MRTRGITGGCFCLAFVLVVGAGVASAQEQAGPLDIGTRRELFVDSYLIESLNGGARQVLHHPTPRELAVDHDEKWEGNTCGYHTVFQDGDLYRMYYRGSHHDVTGSGRSHPQLTCYAESDDGIHWRKPELGLFEFEGSKKNNIVWMGVGTHNFAPFKDTNPDCKPEAQYKAFGRGKGGLWIFKSPDGIHWSLIQKGAVITKGAFDSQNLAFWDSLRGRYVDFHRGFRNGVRDIMTCTSKDFREWTEPVWLAYPDAPKEHLYTNQIIPYPRAPHLFMGFPKRFMPSRRMPGNRMKGLSDGVFMTSRDGLRFHRWTEAFIRPGLQRLRWVNRNNMTAWGIVETASAIEGLPNELSVYSTEGYYRGESCQIRRYSLRLDGFVSVQAPLDGGELITKPLIFAAPEHPAAEPPRGAHAQGAISIDTSNPVHGTQLLVNYSTSAAGSLRCEIQDASGQAVPGYSMDDCDLIYGDHIERPISWEGRTELKQRVGHPVRLRFELKDADLYAIRFGQPE